MRITTQSNLFSWIRVLRLYCYHFRVKKEFDDSTGQTAQAMGPNTKGSMASAISATVGPAIDVAKNLNLQSPISTNADQLPAMQQQSDQNNDIQIKNENDIGDIMRKISSQKQPTLGLKTGIAGDPCIDVGEDEDADKEEYVPHFQRVSISGDDNTGVSYNQDYINYMARYIYIYRNVCRKLVNISRIKNYC